MKGESIADCMSVQPARTASASEIDGKDIPSVSDVGINWVKRRAFDALPSVIPAFNSEAMDTQSAIHMPLGPKGSDLL